MNGQPTLIRELGTITIVGVAFLVGQFVAMLFEIGPFLPPPG